MSRMMYVEDPNKYFNLPYLEYLKTSTTDYGQQKLEETEAEIAARENRVASTSSGSKTIWIVLGIASVGLITFAILKKKGII